MRKRTRKRNTNKFKIKQTDFTFFTQSKKVTLLVFFILFILILGFFSVIFAITNVSNTNIIAGIYINNIDVSNKSKSDVKKLFDDILNKKKYDGITITHNDEKYTMELGLLEIQTNLNNVLDEVNTIGRSGNIVKDNYDIIKAKLFQKKYNLDLKYNKENLLKEFNWIYNELPDKYKEMDYYVDDSNLVLAKAVSGIIINEDELVREFERYINNYSGTLELISLPFQVKQATDVDVEKLYKEIYIEPKDAYYVEKPFKIYPEVKGVDFAISNNKIIELLNANIDKNEYNIPLKITVPETTLANLSIDVFPNVLSKSDGIYDVTNYNRANNLTIAGQKINEYVIAPSEVFSYNKILGARTISAGYKEAAIYSGGKIINGLGGGICQISSILYNAVLKANLEIVERKCHQFLPGYAKPGLDATVAYGSIDFKFKNNRTYPIKIKTNVVAGVAEIEIWGIKEDTDVTVSLENKVIETVEYKTQYINNSSLEKDAVKLIQAGTDGKTVETYKITSKGAEEISRELIAVDKYDVLNEVYEKN